MLFNNTRNQKIERRSDIEVFKILNGYENILTEIFFHSQGREKDYRTWSYISKEAV